MRSQGSVWVAKEAIDDGELHQGLDRALLVDEIDDEPLASDLE